jgi:hypothetical protein
MLSVDKGAATISQTTYNFTCYVVQSCKASPFSEVLAACDKKRLAVSRFLSWSLVSNNACLLASAANAVTFNLQNTNTPRQGQKHRTSFTRIPE